MRMNRSRALRATGAVLLLAAVTTLGMGATGAQAAGGQADMPAGLQSVSSTVTGQGVVQVHGGQADMPAGLQ